MSNWWTDQKQNDELAQLRDEMTQTLSETSSLRSRLSEVQGGLQNKVDRLSTAFDAFVELSDLRYELAGFLDAAELRRYASRVLSALASGTPLPVPGNEVPQYWLGPAVEALIALHATAPTEDTPLDGPLAEAMALDQRRTSIFLSLALAALGLRQQVRTEWLDVAFGVPAADGTLTRVQRVLWATAARGGFGADGLALVVKRLQSVDPPAEGWLPKVEKRADPGPASGPGFPEVAEQEHARTRLARIRSAVEAITGDTEALEPDRDLGYAASSEPTPDSTAALLRQLIAEGSEPEQEPMARMAVLRTRITDDWKSTAEKLDDPAGTVEKLLQTDLSRKDEPHLVAAALRVIAPTILPGVEDLAQVAGRPSPAGVIVEDGQHSIEIRPDGPDPLELDKAARSIETSTGPLTPGQLAVPAVLAAAGALIAIGLGLLNPLWIVLGLVLIGIGVFRYWNLRVGNAADRATAADKAARLRERCATVTDQLATYTKASADRQAAIANDVAELRRHLTA